jgi:hypothetical protein
MQCMYSSNSTEILGINTECIPTSFLQRRLGWLCIYSVEKYSKVVVKDTYPGYMIEMTQHSHEGQHRSILQQDGGRITPEIESYSDKIKFCN